MELFNFSIFIISAGGTELDNCDLEWFSLEMNWGTEQTNDSLKVTETACV